MVLLDKFFCDKIFVKIHICILWHKVLNDLVAQIDFDKNFVTKKLVK